MVGDKVNQISWGEAEGGVRAAPGPGRTTSDVSDGLEDTVRQPSDYPYPLDTETLRVRPSSSTQRFHWCLIYVMHGRSNSDVEPNLAIIRY